MSNKTATFWKYTGNHQNGKDCDRKDPHGFGLSLISYVAWIGDGGGEYELPLTYQDTKLIKTKHGKNDGFGEEVSVSAPQEIWDKARESQKKVLAMY